jgi:hypothetical protein
MTHFVQLLNPKSKYYVKVDRKLGRIVGYKKDGKPYKNVPIVYPEAKKELAPD